MLIGMRGQALAQQAEEQRAQANKEAEAIIKEAKLKSKEEELKMRDEFEEFSKDRRRELQELEKRLSERESGIERKMDLVQSRLDDLGKRDSDLATGEKKLRERSDELDTLMRKQTLQLEGIAMLTRDQARVQLMQRLEQELTHERGTMIRRHVDRLKQECERESQKILVAAMQRFAGECAYDRTTKTVSLPSDEMKGRIIGREGRNIRVFESETGVNVLIDDTPSAVVITCFDPVRLEVARLALERLVADGRIHPTRVEEVVAKAKTDVEADVVTAGEDALHALHITDIPDSVVAVLGRLRYRYSYSQNVLQHSVEVANFMAMVASELGLDVDTAKRMGLFHDIGKALDHDHDGSHALIGRDFLARAGISAEVCNGVGCHHDEIPAETPLAAMVSVCDALSASRPGARSETTELYLRRLDKLEEIGNSFTGVDHCYAVQAGRELRVLVEPDDVNESEAFEIARNIAQRVENEMEFPGQIKVCVIRETRSIEYAK
jgi:ribonuclease Y